MREWTTAEGLKNFGVWFKRTRHDSSLWPPALKIWFGETSDYGRKLTQQELCDWLAIASGDPEIEDYLARIKSIEAWTKIKTIADAKVKNIKESNLLIALAQSGFLSIRTTSGDIRPVFSNDIWIFREVLKGNINPITGRYPLYPVGRGAGPSVRAFLDGLTLATRGESIQDLLVRMDFALGNERWTEKDIVPGSWFGDLLAGKIYDLELYDLTTLAKTVESYFRRHNKSTINFGVDDLLTIIHRDKGGAKVFSEPSNLPPSFIGRVVKQYCEGHNLNYDAFVTDNLEIKPDRWKKIEQGAKPTEREFETLAFELDRPSRFFEDGWKSTNQKRSSGTLLENETF